MGAALLLVFAFHVQAAGSCPTAEDVEAKLAPLLASDDAGAASELGVVSETDDGGVAISLLGEDGRPRFSRRLPPAASCAEQAETVAVALAAWESEIHPSVALRLDRLAAAPIAAPAVPATEPAVQVTAAPPGRHLTLALGVAALVSLGPDLAPGARAGASVGREGDRLRWQLSISAIGNLEESLGPGRVNWWRVYWAAGPEYALSFRRRWQVAIGAGPVIGLASTAGGGYPVNRETASTDVGAEARLRLAVRWQRLAPWAGITVVSWLRRQTVLATGSQPSSLDLPVLEPMLSVGAEFFSRP